MSSHIATGFVLLTALLIYFLGGIATMVLTCFENVQIWMILGFASIWAGILILESQNHRRS